MNRPIPARVAAALARAEAARFPLSSEHGVGRLLSALAAGVPANGRILEMGTGVGVGMAWMVEGLGRRTDVEIFSIELDAKTHAIASSADWPPYVKLLQGDVLAHLGGLGTFDLIFADAQGGKWEGLGRTIAALRPHGILLVDDMTPLDGWDDHQRRKKDEVRDTLLTHPDLVAAELAESSGMILSVRR